MAGIASTIGLATALLAALSGGALPSAALVGLVAAPTAIAVAVIVGWHLRGEDRAREEAMRLRDAVDTLPDGFVLYDSNDRVVMTNQRYRELHPQNPLCGTLGARFEDIFRAGIACGETPMPAAEIEDTIRMRLARHCRPGESFEQRSGDRWLRISERKTADGGLVAIHTDITALKRAQAETVAAGIRISDWAEAANDWFWECDAEHKMTFVSEGFGKALGIDPASRPGQSWFEIVDGFDPEAPRWREHLAVRAAREPFRDFVLPMITEHGRRYISTSAKPIWDDAGTFLGYRGTSTDVTRRIEAEQAAEAAKARMTQFAATASDWFWEADAEGGMTFLSENFEAATGIAVSSRMGTKRFDLTVEADPDNPGWDAHLAQAALHEPFRDFVMAVQTPNGRKFLSVSGSPCYDAGGTFQGYRGTTRNVTAQTEAERTFRYQTQLLSSLIQNLPIGVSLVGPDRRFLAFNQVYIKLFDLPAGFLRPGDPLDKLLRYNAARGIYGTGDTEAVIRDIIERVRTGTALIYERSIVDRTVEFRRNPLPDGTVVTTLIDVTDARNRERDLLTAHRQLAATAENLAAANAAKSQFLANMSHELRTPLNAIIGFSEILRDTLLGPQDPRYAEYARDINASGTHLLGLVNDLLDLSKIDAGRVELREDLVDLRELIEESCRLVSDQAREGQISLVRPAAFDPPPVRVDRVRLKQVLLNLMSNAVKFTSPGGRVTVSAEWSEHGMTIAIADTGIGMRAEDIPVALEPFRQLESAYTRQHQGTGLGLPLAKSLTELHGGRLDIESRLAEGTTVRVQLPPSRLVGPFIGSCGSESQGVAGIAPVTGSDVALSGARG